MYGLRRFFGWKNLRKSQYELSFLLSTFYSDISFLMHWLYISLFKPERACINLFVTPSCSNTTGEGEGSILWEKLWHYYQLNREDFLTHYHKRSNVESTMWMIKSKFDEHIRNKTDEGIINELYCKVLCHNICVVIQSMYELGIEPSFWTGVGTQKVEPTLCAETLFAHNVPKK